MFDGDPDQIYKVGQKFGWPLPRAKTSKFPRDFTQLRDLITNISGTQHDIVNRKNGVAKMLTTDTPAQANLIPCLVHKPRKIGPDF